MKGIARTICLLLGLLAVRTVGAQQQQRQQQQQQQQWERVVKTCGDLPSSELTGITTLLNPISCDPPVMLHVREEALLRSDGVIETTGVHFVVHEHGTLHASGKAIEMRRLTDMPPHLHLIMANGRFNLHVTDYIPSIAGAAEEDKRAIVWEGAEGLFQSKNTMVRFTEHSMVVSKIPTANEGTEPDDFLLLDARAKRELLAKLHDELRARAGLDEAEKKPAPPAATIADSVAHDATMAVASDGSYGAETTTVAGDSTVLVLDRNADQLGSTDIDDQASVHQMPPVPTRSPTSIISSNGGSSGSGDLPSSPSHASSGGSSSGGSSSKDGESGSGAGGSGTGGSGTGGGGETNDGEESAPSSDMKVHPALSLKVGEVLSGTLLSPTMGSRIFASREDGAIVFAKATGEPPRDGDGRVTGPTPKTITTLVASDPGKVNKRHAIRAELLAEELYERLAEAEGHTGKQGALATIAGWMPFGKGGFLRRRAREHAKAHMGEVNLYVTNRGHLEGSIDGTRVARKSGPSWFGYRTKDPSYELWVTHSGVEITRNGMLDWSIEAENKV